MKKTMKLPENFILGAAASAWQLEGWGGKDKESRHYMDAWYMATPELWHDGVGPTIAADFYNRYKTDVPLMADVGLNAYRTSIDWTRFIKDYETGEVDEDGLRYYDDLIDRMIENGIEPMLCLEHYELPVQLFEKYGGWGSRHVIDCFVKYAEQAFKHFGHKVSKWFTFNEPIVVQTRVYLDSIRWPFEQNTQKWMQWNFHKILATAKVVSLFKDMGIDGKIGVILNPEVTYARSTAEHDLKAAHMYDLYFNRVYMDPHLKGKFPEELLIDLKKHDIMFEFEEGDMEIIKNNTLTYVGLNLYYPHRLKARDTAWNDEIPFHPSYHYELFDLPGKKMNPFRGWEIYPKIIFDIGLRMRDEYENVEWFVAESGMGVQNEQQYRNEDGIIQDDYRIDYIKEHLYWTLRAIEEGVNCTGYMLWAFMDNVSPQNAFKNRYGLVSIDREDDLKRSIKKSGYWYKDVQNNREFEIDIKQYEFDNYKFDR